jgi:hypothetical protein
VFNSSDVFRVSHSHCGANGLITMVGNSQVRRIGTQRYLVDSAVRAGNKVCDKNSVTSGVAFWRAYV